MRRFFVQIKEDSFRRLVDLAVVERRDVRDQAAIVLESALRDAGKSAAQTVPILVDSRQAVTA